MGRCFASRDNTDQVFAILFKRVNGDQQIPSMNLSDRLPPLLSFYNPIFDQQL